MRTWLTFFIFCTVGALNGVAQVPTKLRNVVLESEGIIYGDGIKQTFNPSSTTSGLNVGVHTADPVTVANGDVWYNTTLGALRARINNVTLSLGAGGGGGSNATHTGDALGDTAITVVGINGVTLSGLQTGILKNTTVTGVPSIATAGDFPTLNQNTTGSAATLTTPRTINGVSFNGSTNITVTAAAGTLTGTALPAGVVTSSLTSVGTLANLNVSGAITLAENTSVALNPAGSASGKYSGVTITGTGGAAIAFGDLVTLSSVDARWDPVNVTATAAATGDTRGLLGIAVTSSTDGAPITVLMSGVVRADANFPGLTVSSPVYATGSGDISSTKPTTSGSVIRILGHALTPHEIYFSPDNTWVKIN